MPDGVPHGTAGAIFQSRFHTSVARQQHAGRRSFAGLRRNGPVPPAVYPAESGIHAAGQTTGHPTP
ncbi:hypothetical protein; RMQ12284 [Methylorubrum extorquens AM1]|uniref:Uncharacterized protein n=1 Tax=Methylorubrum extorquens (strain ATCC 14718 / DSM 1338 / JCM 2805 / NCIMB 9133 / AM1) TaxID=272630 RepID=C5ARU4_METEA|nr:hypothetical protein; RMQ12284 [Methylorubrum extorquens AM1]